MYVVWYIMMVVILVGIGSIVLMNYTFCSLRGKIKESIDAIDRSLENLEESLDKLEKDIDEFTK